MEAYVKKLVLQNPCKMCIKPLQAYADYYDFGEGDRDITKPGRCYSVYRVVFSLLLQYNHRPVRRHLLDINVYGLGVFTFVPPNCGKNERNCSVMQKEGMYGQLR